MFSRATVILRTLSIFVLRRFWKANIEKEKVIAVPKKPLFLALPYLDHYHFKLEPSLENHSRVFAIVANYRLRLRVKTN